MEMRQIMYDKKLACSKCMNKNYMLIHFTITVRVCEAGRRGIHIQIIIKIKETQFIEERYSKALTVGGRASW